MHKIITAVIIVGVVLIALYCVMDPLQGGILLVASLPFLFFTWYTNRENGKLRKKISQILTAAQMEKEEIARDLRRQEQRHREQFERIQAFGQDLSTSLTKDQLMRTVVKAFTKVTSSTASDSQCFLLSHTPGTDDFVYEIGDNFDSTMLKTDRFNATDDLLKLVISTKQCYTYVTDVFGADSHYGFFIKEERMSFLAQLGAMVLLPLILEEQVWGILVIFCREEAAARIKHESEFFSLLLAQASVALGSAIHRGLASVDRLTQLYNRNFLYKRMKEEMEFCNRQQLPLSVVIIDIDHFKAINDSYGHQEGDMVLKKVAQIINKNVRLTDVCARYGGEEFVVVLPGILEKREDRFSIAERLRAAVESAEFFVLEQKRLTITISLGVAVRIVPQDKNMDSDALIKKADECLYKAKRNGRNQVCYPDDVQAGGAASA
ncbi:MAG: diguanylate cyclase [Candidatus Omnitrophica bacterium]|nr:diguanylate cyclase [Candidatus Omnitrophota bacterium]